MDSNVPCPNCKLPVLAIFYFCPNCGKELRPKPLSTSIGKQIGIYLLSFFLPPLGLWPGVKYLMQKESKVKIVGLVAIILTVISVLITLNIAMSLMEQINSQFKNQLNNQLQNAQPQFNQLPL